MLIMIIEHVFPSREVQAVKAFDKVDSSSQPHAHARMRGNTQGYSAIAQSYTETIAVNSWFSMNHHVTFKSRKLLSALKNSVVTSFLPILFEMRIAIIPAPVPVCNQARFISCNSPTCALLYPVLILL